MLSGNGCDRTDADKMSTDAKLMQTNFFKLMLDIFLDVFSRKNDVKQKIQTDVLSMADFTDVWNAKLSMSSPVMSTQKKTMMI